MLKKGLVYVLVLCLVSSLVGCASTKSARRADVEKEIQMGLEATYWATYTAGKVLEIPKLATGGPAPGMVFDLGLKAAFIPLALAIKASKNKKEKEKKGPVQIQQNNLATEEEQGPFQQDNLIAEEEGP